MLELSRGEVEKAIVHLEAAMGRPGSFRGSTRGVGYERHPRVPEAQAGSEVARETKAVVNGRAVAAELIQRPEDHSSGWET